jgi:hypothetical protein
VEGAGLLFTFNTQAGQAIKAIWIIWEKKTKFCSPKLLTEMTAKMFADTHQPNLLKEYSTQ